MDERPASGRMEVFDMAGEGALAWFFVMANWSEPSDRPSLQVRSGSKLVLCASPRSVAELHRVLGFAQFDHDAVAKSARALTAELTKRGLDLPAQGSE